MAEPWFSVERFPGRKYRVRLSYGPPDKIWSYCAWSPQMSGKSVKGTGFYAAISPQASQPPRAPSMPRAVSLDLGSRSFRPRASEGGEAHTLGIPGADSPTAERAAYTLWRALADISIMCSPWLEVSTENYGLDSIFVWVIVWWKPIQHYRGMLRPAQWHTTLARATVRATVGTAAALRGMEGTLVHVMRQCLAADPYPLQVTRAPWRSSWNFGLADDALQLCIILRLLADRLFGQMPRISVQKHRELHISWH